MRPRPGGLRPRGLSGVFASVSAAATHTGTAAAGTRKSIGTSTICSGLVYATPTSNPTRDTGASARTQIDAAPQGTEPLGTATAASATAAAMNPPPTTSS